NARSALLHSLHAFVPAANDVAGAELELERVVAVLARVELGALGAVLVEPAGVVDAHVAAGFGALAVADDGVVVLESGRGGLHWRFPVVARTRRTPRREIRPQGRSGRAASARATPAVPSRATQQPACPRQRCRARCPLRAARRAGRRGRAAARRSASRASCR